MGRSEQGVLFRMSERSYIWIVYGSGYYRTKKTGDHEKLGAFKTEQAAKRYIDYCLKKREENDAKYSWRNFHIEKVIFYNNW